MNILFYRVRGEEFGFMSNFYQRSIEIDGRDWPSTEHYFQAQKFAGTKYEEAVRKTRSCREAADMGRDRALPMREDWEEVKDKVMHIAVLAKFAQHEDLREKLLATGDAVLVEHTRNDHYWGDGGDGRGKNMLGKTLMRVRDELRRTGEGT